MRPDREAQGFAALKAYVVGDTSEVVVMSDLRGYRAEEIRTLLSAHHDELEAIDPARHVILESILPAKR